MPVRSQVARARARAEVLQKGIRVVAPQPIEALGG